MVALALNQTVTIPKVASIAVDPGIPPGRYRIQLVVTDTDNAQSAPTFIQLVILPLVNTGGPTGPVLPINPVSPITLPPLHP